MEVLVKDAGYDDDLNGVDLHVRHCGIVVAEVAVYERSFQQQKDGTGRFGVEVVTFNGAERVHHNLRTEPTM